MRIAAFVATAVLAAGCSHTVAGHALRAHPAAGAPVAGATIADVTAWIEAGHPVDLAGYHSATRDGTTTQLGVDIAFTATAGKTSCAIEADHRGALACRVRLTNPPPRPDTAYGKWEGGWVDFDGATLQVGAARADPGPFLRGDGPQLADGNTLSLGDYRCRADRGGLFCANYPHQSAARFASEGIQPFGCLRSVPPPDGVGIAFGC
jgi:hypothetical protein